MSGKRSRQANMTIFSLSVVGIVVCVNVLAARYPVSFDLTSSRLNSLAPQTIQVLNQLREPVKLLAFMQKTDNPYLRQMKDVLEAYRRQSSMLTYEVIDFEGNPLVANEYGVTQVNSVVMVRGTQRKLITARDVFTEDPAGRPMFRGEQYFTNALLNLFEDKPQAVYFTEGHGEWLIDDGADRGAAQVKSALESENRLVKKINLAMAKEVPEDGVLLVLAGPTKPFSAHELGVLRKFVAKGGKVFAGLEVKGDPQLGGWLKEWGVEPRRRLVMDPERSPLFKLFPTQVIPLYQTHPITDKLAEARLLIIWNTVMPLREVGDHAPHLLVQPLMETSPKGFGKADFSSRSTHRESGDDAGPLMMAYAVSREAQKPIERIEEEVKQAPVPVPVMVVCGDADFLSNEGLLSAPGNRDFFLNSVSWLLSERQKISIRPKSAELRRIRPLLREDALVVFWTSVVCTPLMILGLGVMVWWRRR